MNPNLWNVRMKMRVSSYYEVHRMFYFNLCSMNNDEEMRYLWTIQPHIAKEGIHIVVDFEPIQQQNIPSTNDKNTTTLPEHITAVTRMVSDELSMLYSTVNNDDNEFQTPLSLVNPVNPVTKNIVQEWESSQWFSNSSYDYTHSGAFLDIGSGSPIDDLVESSTVRLLDWNDSMTDIQLDMRFVDKVQAVSAVFTNNREIPVLNIIQEVQVLFQIGYTYKRAWYARKFAIERIFGSWDITFSILPKYLQAVQDLNSRTVYEFLHHRTSSPPKYVFKFVFWCFSPCIDGFPYCRPVISVDGTHLRGSYKGVLLIASTWDANNHLFPLAFAIVDKESSESWNCSLKTCENTLSKIVTYALFMIATKCVEKWVNNRYLCAGDIFATNVQKNLPSEFSSVIE
ncbi:hypothetical protein M9H77_34810 [Catharanthus roseus]|uniref:Uncharacterized protein n=1 Tax=Catharanthus roseus TaxID=4058 RepID=A0ACB9ZQV5_CATRO|nr:hypothetical protein M9H77_34810 [Catharanthus roseus]